MISLNIQGTDANDVLRQLRGLLQDECIEVTVGNRELLQPTNPPGEPPLPVPPAPTPPAPTPPVGAVNLANPTVELDRDSQPWDARIHSKGQTKVIAGTWKLKRDITPDLVMKVRSEHLANPDHPLADATPSPNDIMSFNIYAAKVVASGKWGYDRIQQLLVECGYQSITDVRAGAFEAVAGELQAVTGISY